jgi:hypothetical protein
MLVYRSRYSDDLVAEIIRRMLTTTGSAEGDVRPELRLAVDRRTRRSASSRRHDRNFDVPRITKRTEYVPSGISRSSARSDKLAQSVKIAKGLSVLARSIEISRSCSRMPLPAVDRVETRPWLSHLSRTKGKGSGQKSQRHFRMHFANRLHLGRPTSLAFHWARYTRNEGGKVLYIATWYLRHGYMHIIISRSGRQHRRQREIRRRPRFRHHIEWSHHVLSSRCSSSQSAPCSSLSF